MISEIFKFFKIDGKPSFYKIFKQLGDIIIIFVYYKETHKGTKNLRAKKGEYNV